MSNFSQVSGGPTNISGHPSGDPPEAPHQLFEKAQNLIHFQGHGRMVLVQHSYPMFFLFSIRFPYFEMSDFSQVSGGPTMSCLGNTPDFAVHLA